MKWGDAEWRQMAHRRAAIAEARALVDDIDRQLRAARLQRQAASRPLIYKIRENALVAPPVRYTDYSRDR